MKNIISYNLYIASTIFLLKKPIPKFFKKSKLFKPLNYLYSKSNKNYRGKRYVKHTKQEATMEKDLYDLTVSCILEHQEKFYRLAYSYVRNKESALDIVQNSICTALEKCYTIKNPQAIKTWLYKIIINEALQHIKASKNEAPTDETLPEQSYNEPYFDKNMEVYEAVQNLSEPVRTVIILHYYEDLTIKQIAEITNTNPNTVKTRLYSGLSKLENKLSKEAFA